MRNYTWLAVLSVGMLVGAGVGTALSQASQRGPGYRGTPDDFMQISQLFSAYSYAIDNKDGLAWAATFAPDGEFQDPDLCVKGHEGLVKIVGDKPELGHDVVSHHTPELGPIVYQDRDHATVRSTLVTYSQRGPGKPHGGVNMTGVYADRLVRDDGRWLFAHRTVYRLSRGPAIACALKP